MEFTKERLPRERFYVSSVKTFESESRGHHWRHYVAQQALRRQRLARVEMIEIERLKALRKQRETDMPLQILENEVKFGQGRGRSATPVDIDPILEQLTDALETENPVDMANRLNGTFVQVVRGDDFTGSVSGASKALKEWANDNGIIASFRKAEDALTKTHLKFTLRLNGDYVAQVNDEPELSEIEDEDDTE